MITVQIGGESRTLDQITEQWITHNVNARFAGGGSVCVRVTIRTADVSVVLTTPDCPMTGGGGREPNAQEARILALWEKRGLRQPHYTPGDVISFLKQVGTYT